MMEAFLLIPVMLCTVLYGRQHTGPTDFQFSMVVICSTSISKATFVRCFLNHAGRTEVPKKKKSMYIYDLEKKKAPTKSAASSCEKKKSHRIVLAFFFFFFVCQENQPKVLKKTLVQGGGGYVIFMLYAYHFLSPLVSAPHGWGEAKKQKNDTSTRTVCTAS